MLVDVAKSALQATTSYEWPSEIHLPGYRPVTRPHAKQIKEAVRLILDAKRPVLYVGGGTIRAAASRELLELAALTGIPVVTTLMARGAFPDSHPQHLGMPGMHGTVAAVAGLQRSDLIISLGARFDDRVTGNLDSFAPGALVIHADIDPAEIGKNREADVPIVGDCREVIADLTTLLRTESAAGHTGDYEAWVDYLAGLKKRYPVAYDAPADGSLAPQYVIERLSAIAGPETIYCAGVGQHQMWAAHYVDFENPGTWINSGGLGTMGYAVPAAMGAKVGRPEATVWAIDGDGCFQMTNQELATCAINDIPIKVAIINNESLGMVRQWQTLFYNERYSNTDLDRKRIPDFVKLAEAYGCVGLACDAPDDVDATIEKAMSIDDRPVVVDFRVHRDAMVWPMVAAGTSNDDIKYARDLAPRVRQGRRVSHEPTPCRSSSRTSPACWPGSPGLFSRRGFNIESLAVGPTEHDEISRMTIVVNVEDSPLEQVTKQLNKLVEVIKIVELDGSALGQPRADAGQGARRRRHPRPGARRRPAVPGQGRRRGARRGHHRGHRQRRQARATSGGCSSPSGSASSCSRAWSPSAVARARSASGAPARSPSRSLPASPPEPPSRHPTHRPVTDTHPKESPPWPRCSTTTTPTCPSSRARTSRCSATAARATPMRCRCATPGSTCASACPRARSRGPRPRPRGCAC